MPKRPSDEASPLPRKRIRRLSEAGDLKSARPNEPSNGPVESIETSLSAQQLAEFLESPILTPKDNGSLRSGAVEDLMSSMDDRQLAEFLESPTLTPTRERSVQVNRPTITLPPETSVHVSPSSEDSDDEMPYSPLGDQRPDKRGRSAGLIAAEQQRSRRLLDLLMALPKDIQKEYLGPNFNSQEPDALGRYELGLGVASFSRIPSAHGDVPDIVIQLHPHLFVSLDKFKQMVTCALPAARDSMSAAHLWKRFALVEAPPFRSEDSARGICKRDQAEMDVRFPAHGPLNIRETSDMENQPHKLVDARTYVTLKALIKQSNRKDAWQEAALTHLAYLKSTVDLTEVEMKLLTDYSARYPKNPPQILARKGDHTFISGEMVKASQELLQANVWELHAEEQIQLMNHFPSGDATGEYKSLFTHTKGRFAFPSETQSEQLGLPRDHRYKKEGEFDDKLEHRDYFYDSIRRPAHLYAQRDDHSYVYPTMNFTSLLKSDYHKLRLCVSLIEAEAPFDLDRCEKIKGLLDLDDSFQYKSPVRERPRERDTGRG